MPKIKNLIDFEVIKDVIDLDSDINTVSDKKKIVKDYIISERLKSHIMDMAENISKPTHKSIQIIGGYGSGKSHLLAWIVSLLENKELVDEIIIEDVRAKFKEVLNRDFAVVQFELQPGASPLSDFFFDRAEQQLEDKYNIKIPVRDPSRPDDFKRDIKDIVNKVKEKESTMGFVVVIDEISDFLKQKTKQQINRDIQFLRILGQVSQSMDFLFFGSMQENVFSNPKYIDEAESFGRVSERFDIVTISREDIERVISRRVLKKDLAKRDAIDTLLSEYKKTFPPINANPDLYIDLFPVHPYVIKIFNELPYFEKRGAIQFTMERVKEILDCDFPKFITYDNVFDEINSKHSIRNLDEVHPIIEAIESLESKIDLLEQDKQKDARRLIKALGVLKLYGKTTNNGATPEELANQLLITSKNIKNVDRILLILNKVREVTSGQFITKTKDNYFYLNLEQIIDYDEVIKRKMNNLPEGMEDEELLSIIKYTDLIDAQHVESYIRTFLDTANWTDKKSFRRGQFIFDDGSDQVKKGDLDFNLVVLSPYKTVSKLLSSKDTAILPISYDDEIEDILKKLAATHLFISERYAKGAMEKRYYEYKSTAKELLLKTMLDAEIEIDGIKRKVKSVITKEPENIDEYFHYLKEELFNEYFNNKYNKYPKFLNHISYENIKGEVETTIKELLQKGEMNLFSNAKNILSSLDLIDIDGNIDTESSIFVKIIIEELEKNKGKNVKVDDLVS
jgi:KaiC/GvpD/RAD55 family RecA-like ATPase